MEQLLALGVDRIILVENGVSPYSSMLFNEMSLKTGKIALIKNNKNLGSAEGFGMGIRFALATNCEFLWLLDDDSQPEPDTLTTLFNIWQKLNNIMGPDMFALFCFRKEHHPDLLNGRPLNSCYLKKGSFLGFHISNLKYRLPRFFSGGVEAPENLPEIMEIPYASYGGFFAHRSVYQKIGLPKPEFVLYQDDCEYTHRLTRSGGKIYLCPYAQLHSLENSWHREDLKFRFGIDGLFKMVDDFRVYYNVRNLTNFEKKYYNAQLGRMINIIVYLSLIGLWSIFNGKLKRLWLIIKAIADGECGRLGYNKSYSLP